MKIIRQLTDELQPGMVINQDIYNRNKVLLLAKGATLSDENIKTIKRLGYSVVSVQKDRGQVETEFWTRFDEEKYEDFQKSYNHSQEEITGILKKINEGEKVNVDKVYEVPHTILKEARSPYNLFIYLSQVEQLDDHTYSHSINVSLICSAICQWMDIDPDNTKDIIVAGLLHDIGKSRINPDILNKPGQLTPVEWEEMKKHTIYGYRILEEAQAPYSVRIGALFHHERMDGKGYPTGLPGREIPLTAKIVAVADVYDAMTSKRTYRAKACPFKVIDRLQSDFYTVLDTKILLIFLSRIAECYVGDIVRLSDGRTGQVAVINRLQPSRPMVRTSEGLVNLFEETGIEIEGIVPAE
ncbi:MAG: HD-GYP domain-containing protein [Actinobacteria bacterium]|nr:HD-GYP domain-containing protein [Actinomycetota bacterium]